MDDVLNISPHPLAAIIAARGISKLNVAGATGIGTSRIYMLLNGQAKPSAREAELLNGVMQKLTSEDI